MRLLTLTTIVLLGVLLTASAAFARGDRGLMGLENAIELVDGSGLVVVNVRGALIGTLDEGKITITDFPDAEPTDVNVQNETTTRRVDADTIVYTGKNLRFRLFRGRWKIEIEGTGIDASAVGSGTLRLSGTEGRYSFAGASYRPWPANALTIRLGD